MVVVVVVAVVEEVMLVSLASATILQFWTLNQTVRMCKILLTETESSFNGWNGS